ncbi:MAG: CYTH domain-containing protein [Patescibacteria group bacterium]
MANKTIEVEFRSRFDIGKYEALRSFLDKNAKDLGSDDKNVHFFILPDELLKVVDNVSHGTAKIVMKLNKIGRGSDFEEIEVVIAREDVDETVQLFKSLNITDKVMHSFQKRRNYLYKGVELALKWSEIWGHHLELEMVVDDKSKQKEVESKLRAIADELGVEIMTDDELAEFTRRVEENYQG